MTIMVISSRPCCCASSSLQLLFLLLLLQPLLHTRASIEDGRNIDYIEQQHGARGPLCNTTVQGRHLRSDDRGYVCKIMEVHALTGCCPENNEQYSCRGCNMDSRCCNGYEFCVSCCLNPMHTPAEIALKTKVAKQVTAGTSSSVFDYCRSRCRHNSDSVVHENAYASEDHHCFALEDNSADEGPERDGEDLDNLTIVIGRQGQSCETACKGRGKTCKLSALAELNKCTMLKKYLNCKEACIASPGQEQPGEVVSTAPRHMHPGACLYNAGKVSFSCEGFHPYSRRLCPCE
ncbi:unnamed protein product [Calypogeia fissa]